MNIKFILIYKQSIVGMDMKDIDIFFSLLGLWGLLFFFINQEIYLMLRSIFLIYFYIKLFIKCVGSWYKKELDLFNSSNIFINGVYVSWITKLKKH